MFVLAGVTEADARASGISDRTQVANVADAAELEETLATMHGAYDAIILGAALPDPIGAVRRVKARAPDALVLLLATPERCARLQHELLLTPIPGEPARCITLDAGAPQAIEAQVTQARLRRTHRQVLHRASADAFGTRAEPAARLPPIVEAFADAQPIGLIIAEPSGRVAHRNRLARGFTPANAVVTSIEDALPGVESHRVRALLGRAARGHKERLALRTPGGLRHFDATAGRLELAGGRSVAIITLDDVTSLVEAEDRLERARASATRVDKLASMGSLVGGLAHEIRTPLTAILNHVSMLDLLAERAAKAADPKEDLARLRVHAREVAESVDRIRDLTRDLNRFMRGEQPEKRVITLNDAILDAARLFEAAHRGRFPVHFDMSATLPILADPAHVQQIALNLMQNAAEASRAGMPVDISTRDADGAAELVVKDRGTGIPPEVQGRVYEAFVTTKPQGTGLGLSIVRRLAELHGASVTFDTGPAGTTFVVSFPAHEPAKP